MPDKRILIVEDETIVAMTLEDALHDMGYSIAGVVSSSEDALATVGRTKPDLILMDIRIKGEKDGIATAEEINRLYNIPIVYLTAHSDDKTLERAVKTQPYGYLIKPFQVRELHSTIEIALYKHRLMNRPKEDGEDMPYETGAVPARSPSPVPADPVQTVQKPAPQGSGFRFSVEHAVLDVLDLPVFVLDRDLHLEYYNPALVRLFRRTGYLAAEVHRPLFEIAPSAFLGTPREYREVFKTGKAVRFEKPIVIDDHRATYSLTRVPLFEKDIVVYVAVILKDISRELVGTRKSEEIRAGYEELLRYAGEITRITGNEEDPKLKQISKIVSEMVITLAKIDPQWPGPREE
ncbi:MAG: response regulator [Methanoregula sp.]|nr:response regulator [Methanoregula sp.]